MLDAIDYAAANPIIARRIVERFHGAEAAEAALADFNTRFSARDLGQADLPVFKPTGARDILGVVVEAFSVCFQTAKSRSDARRLVEGGSVQWRGEKIPDPKFALPAGGGVLKLDKTRAVRVED